MIDRWRWKNIANQERLTKTNPIEETIEKDGTKNKSWRFEQWQRATPCIGNNQ